MEKARAVLAVIWKICALRSTITLRKDSIVVRWALSYPQKACLAIVG
jgi:hypothetical protein